eukprot:TRINITY_DN1113_c2_g1_i3.p1 TRINITY_DN1113_c2_g1~~TRINITY_DN1113_c2_g1_i3.p1  ORF type:complete len:553 (+),score=104.45 TRINITY_DN1113_c2_g1_i3:37-1695(+)
MERGGTTRRRPLGHDDSAALRPRWPDVESPSTPPLPTATTTPFYIDPPSFTSSSSASHTARLYQYQHHTPGKGITQRSEGNRLWRMLVLHPLLVCPSLVFIVLMGVFFGAVYYNSVLTMQAAELLATLPTFAVRTYGQCVRSEQVAKDAATLPPVLYFSKERAFNYRPSIDFDNIYANTWDSKRYMIKYPMLGRGEHSSDDQISSDGNANRERVITGGARNMNFAVFYVAGRSKRPLNPLALERKIRQPFVDDPGVFSFLQTPKDEVLFVLRAMTERDKQQAATIERQRANNDEAAANGADAITPVATDSDSLLVFDCENRIETPNDDNNNNRDDALAVAVVNNHPFAWGCIVLAIQPEKRLPQVITSEALEIGLYLTLFSHDNLRLGFNSLSGGASVNHLHLQGWYFNATPDGQLAIERARTTPLVRQDGVTIGQVEDFPLHALSFTREFRGASPNVPGDDVTKTAELVTEMVHSIHNCLNVFLEFNVAHNIVISPQAKRVFLIPRKPDGTNAYKAKFGFPEVTGQLIIVYSLPRPLPSSLSLILSTPTGG